MGATRTSRAAVSGTKRWGRRGATRGEKQPAPRRTGRGAKGPQQTARSPHFAPACRSPSNTKLKRAWQACRGRPDRAADYRSARTGSAPLLVVAIPLLEVREDIGVAALLCPSSALGPRIVPSDQPPEFMTDVVGGGRGPLPRHIR